MKPYFGLLLGTGRTSSKDISTTAELAITWLVTYWAERDACQVVCWTIPVWDSCSPDSQPSLCVCK